MAWPQLAEVLLRQGEGEEALGGAPHDVPGPGQGPWGQGHGHPAPHLPPAPGAVENPLGKVEPGPRRLLGAADGAALQHGGIAGEAEEFQLKGRLHQGPGFLQGVQGVEGVEEEGEQLRRSLPLLGGGLVGGDRPVLCRWHCDSIGGGSPGW